MRKPVSGTGATEVKRSIEDLLGGLDTIDRLSVSVAKHEKAFNQVLLLLDAVERRLHYLEAGVEL